MKRIATFRDAAAEVHAATHGVYAGLTEWKGAELPDDADIATQLQAESSANNGHREKLQAVIDLCDEATTHFTDDGR